MSTPIAFVTGSTGLLGNNLVRLLIQRGFTVRALARSREKAEKQFAGLPVDVVIGDMTAVSAFAERLTGTDILFHAAAYYRDSYKGGSHLKEALETNVNGTTALLEAAHRAGIRRCVYTSSIAVLDAPPGVPIDETMSRSLADADPYYKSKILAEQALQRFLASHPDFWAAMVLPGWMHGPGDIGPTSAGQMTLDFLAGRLHGAAPAGFSVVDARDAALALIAAAEHGRRGERYLAAGRSMTMAEIQLLLEKVSGVKASIQPVPFAVLFPVAVFSEAWGWLTKKPVLLSWASVKLMHRERGRTHFDSSKSERELNLHFRPAEETLADEVAWYRQNGY
jgi:nucleoside-diphosphate-sugar epimerase